MTDHIIQRREFITLLGGAAAAWPRAARAQQRPAMPVIGYLSARSAESDASMLVAFRRGLREAGYVEGQNLAIEYRFADGQVDRLLGQMSELTRREVGVIVAAAVAATSDAAVRQMRDSQIPIVFNTGADPVRMG